MKAMDILGLWKDPDSDHPCGPQLRSSKRQELIPRSPLRVTEGDIHTFGTYRFDIQDDSVSSGHWGQFHPDLNGLRKRLRQPPAVLSIRRLHHKIKFKVRMYT